MTERRPTKSELRLRRIAAEEPAQGQRGIFELFGEEEEEQLDVDTPLARENDDDTAA